MTDDLHHIGHRTSRIHESLAKELHQWRDQSARLSYFSGTKVMNLVTPDTFSFIQMEVPVNRQQSFR